MSIILAPVIPISTLTTSPMHRFLRPAAFLAVLLAGLPSLGAAQQQLVSNADNMMTVSQLREIADAVIADRVRRYGRDTDPQRRQDIGGVINAVQRTVGYDTHPLKWEIVMDSSLNAAAIPGGGMLINVGLSLYCDGYGRANAQGNAERQRRLYLGCLAAVIGHEFGHLELGHTENVTQTVARRQEMQRRMRQAASVSAAVRDSVITASQRFERDQELAADRAGALYILRIGFEVQDAINLFDSMDRDERQSRQWRNQITWLGGHPRAAERVAELEIARGRLKLLQRDYDDAIALIEANELPDSALAMLDRVLEAFPTMAAANHARAVVLAQQWLNGSDPSDLRVRPAMPAYDARFIGAIRGSNPNQGAAARRPAREAFQRVFTRDAHPYSLANLAVLEAYDGEMAGAIEKVNLAAERAPGDPFVANNQGVVLFLANRNAEARAAFTRAEQAAGNQVPRQVIFNLARVAAAMGDKDAAVRYANRYLQMDSRSNWSREAQQIVSANGGTPAAAPASASINTAPPTVAGVEFGAQRSRVIAALGEPEGGAASAGAVWRYPARGLAIAFDEEGAVKAFVVENRAIGAVGGVTVGDSYSAVTQALGNPHLEQKSQSGMMYRWNRGAWSLTVLVNEGTVRALGAGRN